MEKEIFGVEVSNCPAANIDDPIAQGILTFGILLFLVFFYQRIKNKTNDKSR